MQFDGANFAEIEEFLTPVFENKKPCIKTIGDASYSVFSNEDGMAGYGHLVKDCYVVYDHKQLNYLPFGDFDVYTKSDFERMFNVSPL